MIKKTYSLISLIFFLSACSFYNVHTQETTDNFYPEKTSVAAVEYLEQVDQPHEVLGYVTINAERSRDVQELLSQMKEEAAALGGDAVTDITMDASGLWKRIKPQKLLGNAYVRANYKAKVIAFH